MIGRVEVNRKTVRRLAHATLVVLWAVTVRPAAAPAEEGRADETEAVKAQRAARLVKMRELAQKTWEDWSKKTPLAKQAYDSQLAWLKDLGIAVLQFAAATDQNGFVVTKATSDKYGLTKLSDLAKPLP
jgi:hypothetical protein